MAVGVDFAAGKFRLRSRKDFYYPFKKRLVGGQTEKKLRVLVHLYAQNEI